MSMWTLVIITMIMPGDYRSGAAVTYSQVPYFQNEQSCKDAGAKILNDAPKGNPYFNVKSSFTCVSSS